MKGLLWRWLGGAHAPPRLTFSKIACSKFRVFQKLFGITENISGEIRSCIFGDRMKKDSASLDRAHRVRPFWLVVCPSRAPASPPRPLLLPHMHMWGLRCFIAYKVQSVKWPKLGWARVNCLYINQSIHSSCFGDLPSTQTATHKSHINAQMHRVTTHHQSTRRRGPHRTQR